MRRTLGSVLPAALLMVALAACGDETASDSPDAQPSVTVSSPGDTGGVDSPSEEPYGYQLVDTITVTAAGGTLSELAVPLADDAAVEAFVAQFNPGDLPAQVEAAVAKTDVPEGQELYGAVIAIGCDSPDQVTVDVSDPGVTITAVKVPSPKVECFAAMTTVALVLVDR